MRTLLLLLFVAVWFGGCQRSAPASEPADAPGPLVVYAGRSEALVAPLVEAFRAETGVAVEVRYGKDAELLAALQEEGARSPADVFWANTTGTLEALSASNLLTALPDSLRQRPQAYVPASGLWVPVTVRFRVLAYNPARVDSAALPASVLEVPRQAALRGRVGWTPTYASFQDFVTALRVQHGDSTARAWLDGMQALAPKAYASNTPMLEALRAGEIDVALTNHYYIWRLVHGDAANAAKAGAPIGLHYFAPGDVGNLALVTGAGVLQTATRRTAALRFLAFLLSASAQTQAAATVNEYPVVAGVAVPPFLVPEAQKLRLSPPLDFARLRDLEATQRLLRDAGVQ